VETAPGHGLRPGRLGLRHDDGEGVVIVDQPTGEVDHDIVDDHDDGSGDTGRLVLLW
jgi:hypothetical protein